MFGVKNYVNVYRFLRKYSVFYISTIRFLVFCFCCSGVEGTKKVQYLAPF